MVDNREELIRKADCYLERATNLHATGEWRDAGVAYQEAMKYYAMAGRIEDAHTVGKALVLAERRQHIPQRPEA
jgi:hypothetical protein